MAATYEPSAARFVPPTLILEDLEQAAATCRGCGLYLRATQAVFGAGAKSARLLLVGEQPGDREDLAGEPFVGPAGKMLDRALSEAGIERGATYVTNAVKHFKWEAKGKRRIHATPRESEVRACRPWLAAEVESVAPALIVAMGATATSSVFGRDVKVLRDRGTVMTTRFGVDGMATVHPSSLLRARDNGARRSAFLAFVADLRLAAEASRT